MVTLTIILTEHWQFLSVLVCDVLMGHVFSRKIWSGLYILFNWVWWCWWHCQNVRHHWNYWNSTLTRTINFYKHLILLLKSGSRTLAAFEKMHILQNHCPGFSTHSSSSTGVWHVWWWPAIKSQRVYIIFHLSIIEQKVNFHSYIQSWALIWLVLMRTENVLTYCKNWPM